MLLEYNLTTLQNRFKKLSFEVNLSTTVSNRTALLIITVGSVEENGGRRISIEIDDLDNILLANKILGDNGLLIKERDAYQAMMKEPGNNSRAQITRQHEEKMTELIYDTLVKYFTQMLEAAKGKCFFSDIIPLEKHKQYFEFEKSV